MAWTEEEVLINKNNMLIAEFMGAEILSKESKFSYVQYPMNAWVTDIGAHKETYKQKLHSKQLEYHESYNWIMAVVEKIDSLEQYSFAIDSHPDYGTCVLIHTATSHGIEKCLVEEIQKNKITAIYNAVLIFIKWYNDKRAKDS